jgi:hypothetical protein
VAHDVARIEIEIAIGIGNVVDFDIDIDDYAAAGSTRSMLSHWLSERLSGITGHAMADPSAVGRIFAPGDAGSWDDARVSGPCVLREPDGSWRMWYYGRDAGFEPEIPLPTGRCGLARSDDGLHWTRVPGPLASGAVLDPHPDPARFDSAHVACCDVAGRDGLYWMLYMSAVSAPARSSGATVAG